MYNQLRYDKENIGDLLNATAGVAENFLTTQDSRSPSLSVQSIAQSKLPVDGLGADGVLSYFSKNFLPSVNGSAGPRYFGFVTGGSTPASVIGDWLVSTFDQNACGNNDSIAPHLERQTMQFFRELFGLDQSFFGSFVTGATISNFVSLCIAREWIGQQLGIDISNDGIGEVDIKIVSATPHSSIIKSLAMAGIGRQAVIKPKTLPDREAADLQDLEGILSTMNKPCIVVANAGTVNTVDFDDLASIAALKRKYNFWLHVDAAFGGFAALSDRYKHLMEGIEAADSVTIDAHKWLNVPYDAAMQFTRHKQLQLKVFQNSAAYLGDPETSPDFFHYTPENSRRWRALPAWFTLMAYGANGHREIVERNCDVARHLGDLLNGSANFRLLAPVRMNVVCFTFAEDRSFAEVQTFLASVRDQGRAFFTPTLYKGVPAIRAAISNWQTEMADAEIAFESLESVVTLTPRIL